jgi:hypothetical protein
MMITITIYLGGTWPPVVLAVAVLLALAAVLVTVTRARPSDLPAILAMLTQWFPGRRCSGRNLGCSSVNRPRRTATCRGTSRQIRARQPRVSRRG